MPTIPKGLVASSPRDVSSCVNIEADAALIFFFLDLSRVERVDGSGRVWYTSSVRRDSWAKTNRVLCDI